MVRRVYEQCLKSNLDEVVVATDDGRIVDAVEAFGGRVVLTDPALPSGTDRCREALKILNTDASRVVNIQGDEPFIDPGQINDVLDLLLGDDAEIATLVSPAQSDEEVENPNRVKVVVDRRGMALYFSRRAIPYLKGVPDRERAKHFHYLIHVGIYGFTREALLRTGEFPPGDLELAESLEQLRWLENGMNIATSATSVRAESIDTPEDLQRLEKRHFL